MVKLYTFIKKMQDSMKAIDMRAIKVSIAVALLFAAVWGIYGWHLKDYTNAYRSIMRNFVISQTEKESQAISNEFQSKSDTILYGARSIARMGLNNGNEDISKVLSTMKRVGDFENIVFIDCEGTVYFTDGAVAKDYDVASVIDICDTNKEFTVFNNKGKFLSSYGGFAIIAPVRSGNEIIGYVCGVAPYDILVDEEDFRGDLPHDEVILDKSGNIVAQIYYNDVVRTAQEEVSFFDNLLEVTTEDEFNKLVKEYNERTEAGVPGTNTIETDKGKNTFLYYPIEGSNGWVVMSCYPDATLKSRTQEIQVKALIMFTVIVLIMILAAALIIRYLGDERKRVTELEFLDGLTGAYNRNAFVAHAEKILKENKNLPYYMICFDVINFRIINETYGHERSDIIIKAMAEACKEAFGHNETYGRLTADVFVALTIDDGEEDERIEFIENKIAEEARKVFINHPIKMKRGRYEVININESINRMIDKSNIARKYVNYDKAQFSCQYSENLMNDARKAEEIESRMNEALKNGEFKPYLQGKFNIIENEVVGAEALVRWIRPDGTVVPPGDFIPLFERNGFVEKIDFYMLEEICKYLRRMLDEGRNVYKVSVNQSRYLMNDPEYVSRVKEILLRYQIPVGLIELELTETVFFHEKDRMIKMMNELKMMNVDLSIDDFGSGYSSFNILKDVPFDVLKIDREFLSDSVHTEKGKWILQEIVEMAHGLGMSVICEGVETQEQIDLLASIHCHYAQGFFYSRPIPMEEFIEKFNTIKE